MTSLNRRTDRRWRSAAVASLALASSLLAPAPAHAATWLGSFFDHRYATSSDAPSSVTMRLYGSPGTFSVNADTYQRGRSGVFAGGQYNRVTLTFGDNTSATSTVCVGAANGWKPVTVNVPSGKSVIKAKLWTSGVC